MDRLGFGIVSYFQMLKIFMWFFLVLGIAQIPVMYRFSSYRENTHGVPKQLFENTLVGNLGQSTLKCATFGMNLNDIVFGCPNGSLTEFVSIGVYSTGSPAEENNLCNHNYFEQYDTKD